MKQLLILSGKGGTGKTTVAGAMVRLAEARACADCDVDAPNLHLVLDRRDKPETADYHGLPKASVDDSTCTRCGLCRDICRFGAVEQDGGFRIDARACEGCGLCEVMCPAGAISMHPEVAGELRLFSDEEQGVFSTARLKMGSGTTGLLVTEVKKRMTKSAKDIPLAILDGSPGIGCPVIASIAGVDMVLVVAEPSVSGISDMERILDTVGWHGPVRAVCVNKSDTDPEMTGLIKLRCEEVCVPYVGEIPFDPEVVRIINDGLTLADAECPAGDAVRSVFAEVMRMLGEEDI
ncbi:MAG: ATP-binding protein [Candidatus Methanomethylophilaceae archaeon]|jgi:MinD superfamily P-loop ATPase|nr:ATP-binding protein [Candidatus Methanomethylophilaceae archaeon]NLF33568.1 4Fe-4S binding protein [Thermoplasmatales archaeon]